MPTPSRKTTLVSIYRDAHASLRLVSALTGASMTKLIDDVLIEQFRSMAENEDKIGEVARNFLSGRSQNAPAIESE